MKSMLWKSTLREVRQSLGRFLAIFAIVALGVGFFSGLKLTRTCMIETAGQYLTENEFYDYRILSTLGFDSEEVEEMAGQDQVRAAEGAYFSDVLCVDEAGKEFVLKAHSLTEGINQVVLTAGRMPSKKDECVVDSLFFGKDSLGKKIRIAQDNPDENKNFFAEEEYTIVGTVQSSLYIQFERGNTSLGNGKISGFLYLLPEGMQSDYYTEVYVKFDADFDLYSQDYDTFMDEKEKIWKPLVEKLAAGRYDKVLVLSQNKLTDAKSELEKAKSEGEEKLAEAKQKLDDAKTELDDGKEQLDQASQELKESKELVAKKKEELTKGESTLQKQEEKLSEAEKELEAGEQEWNQQNELVKSKEQEAENSRGQLEVQSAVVKGQEALLLTMTTAMKAGDGSMTQEQLDAAWKELDNAKALLAEYTRQLNEADVQLGQAREALNQSEKQIQDARSKIDDGKAQIAEGKAQIEDGKAQIAKAEREITQGERELAQKQKEWESGKEEYEDGRKQYEESEEEFSGQIADAEKKIASGEKKLAELEEAEGYLLGRNTNVGYVCFESDSSIVDGISNIFPVFFFAVAALVCITTMNRMVEEQRTQIGVLKALGYSNRTIMGKYLFYSGSAAVAGCIFGFFAGTMVFPRVIWAAYGIMYKMCSLKYVFDWKLAAVSMTVSVLCSVGTTWLSCRYELSEVAAQLMRPKAPKEGKRVLLERVPFIWKRMKFLHKVSYRNVFRYRKRFLMMVVGISGCTALLVTGFGVRDSIVSVAADQFDKIQIFDMEMVCSQSVDAGMLQNLEKQLEGNGIGYLTVMEEAVDLVTDTSTKTVNLVAMDEQEDISPFVRLFDKNGKEIAYPGPGECVLNQKLAEDYDIKAGDRIVLREEGSPEMQLTVSAVNENFIYNYVYITAQTYESLTGKKAEMKSVYINLADGADAHRVSAALLKMSGVASVSVNADMANRVGSMLKSMDLIVFVLILCAAGLAFIVLYNLTNINITERIREIATIKVLGFYKKETSAYVFRENVILTFFGALTGLALGYGLHRFVMGEVKIDMVAFDVKILPQSYLYSILLTFVFAWFVNRVMEKKLDQISMTESLKSVD